MPEPGAAWSPRPRNAGSPAERLDSGRGAEPARSERATLPDLTRDPRPVVSRAAFATRYPSWGLATMSLLIVGLLVGFASLRPLAEAINQCAAEPGLVVCRPKMHPVVVALPVAALLVGLVTSLIGGRQVARLGRSPVLAASAGWAVFLLGTAAAYLLASLR